MMARLLCVLSLLALGAGGGCCCTTACGPCGQPMNCLCLPQIPKPIVWNGCCNDCGPCPGEGCDSYCCGGGCGPLGGQGLLPWLRGTWSCGRGCGEVYCDEWVSDPPDCCDPCDQCHGVFTGQGGGYCCLGPFQRLLAALHGYSYCAPPQCGPWRPIFGHCGPVHGGCGCGGTGCSSCGCGAAHGADIYYQGTVEGTKVAPMQKVEGTSILQENWDVPKATPEPGKPIHNARQPQSGQVGRASGYRPNNQAVVRQNTAPAGVRRASY